MSGAANLIETPLTKVRDQIARACVDAGRDPASVTLVAISKTFGANAIEPVIAEGQRVFGENRVQEAKAKWPSLKERHGGIELHLVGALQSNKAKDAVALFDAIHSLDRPSLAEALAKEISKQGRRPTLFVEVNTGGEAQKSGVLPEEADAFVKACRATTTEEEAMLRIKQGSSPVAMWSSAPRSARAPEPRTGSGNSPWSWDSPSIPARSSAR